MSFEASLTGLNLGFHACNADDFLHILSFYLSHDPDNIYHQKTSYDPDLILKYQVNHKDFDCEVNKESLLLNNITAVSVLTIEKLPSEFRLWENINNGSNIFSPEQNITCIIFS